MEKELMFNLVLRKPKIAYSIKGRKINTPEIEIRVSTDGKLSISGGIWNGAMTDYVTCGQCQDELLKAKVISKKFYGIWERWHLNDCNAGNAKQMEFIRKHLHKVVDYNAVCDALKEAGLYEVDGYKYGSAWVKEELPLAVLLYLEELRVDSGYIVHKDAPTVSTLDKHEVWHKYIEARKAV